MSSHVIELKSAFGNTSDPRYFFESQTHTRALQELSKPVEDSRNFRVVLGEPGTGKTVLLLSLLQGLQRSAFTARLFLTQLRREEFLHYFLQELGIARPCTGIPEAQKQLTRVLEENFSRGRAVVVAIDEAHELKLSSLAALAEVLDCRAARSKQLQIILAGLPSLTAKLACPALQPIKERISGIATLRSLTFEESAGYISRRLELCGLESEHPFTDDAIALIARMSEGIPREINNICFEVAFWAEQRGRYRIDSRAILEWAPLELRMRAQSTAHEVEEQGTGTSAEMDCQAPHSALRLVPDKEDAEKCSDSADASPSTSNPARNAKKAAKSISDWFGYERLAWWGTAGELATSLQQPETELIETLGASSEELRHMGLGLRVVALAGRPTSVSLRALDRRQTTREGETVEQPIATESNSEPEGEACAPEIQSEAETFSADESVLEAESQGRERSTENDSHVRSFDGDAVQNAQCNPVAEIPEANHSSAFEQVLGLWKSAGTEEPVEHHPSRWGWVIAAVLLICIVSLALVFTLGGNRPAARQNSPDQRPQQLSPVVSTKPSPSAESRESPSKLDAELLREARSGNADAQLELGTDYVAGRGVPANVVTGYAWMTLAFANGNKEAESHIREISRLLSASDIAEVRRNLSQMYADGTGVPADKVTAYMWQLLAESAGDTRSRVDREQLARSMTPDQIAQAHARASEWLRKHQMSKSTLPAS